VKIPNGVASIRGTMFDIGAAGIVKVYVGSMVVVGWIRKLPSDHDPAVMGGRRMKIGNNQTSFYFG